VNDLRETQLRELLEIYLRVPETPDRASAADVALGREALRRAGNPQTLAHAIRLATLRRHLRNPTWPPLAPVRSLAYYLRTLEGLDDDALHPAFVADVNDRFEALLLHAETPPGQKQRRHDQKAAVSRNR
jgi:hypothetical protein